MANSATPWGHSHASMEIILIGQLSFTAPSALISCIRHRIASMSSSILSQSGLSNPMARLYGTG